jgi:hypothetical protein
LLTLLDPGDFGLWAMAETGDGINHHIIGRVGLETTRFFAREHPFDPTIPLGTYRPLGSFAPEHAKPSGPFGAVVGRLDAMGGPGKPRASPSRVRDDGHTVPPRLTVHHPG